MIFVVLMKEAPIIEYPLSFHFLPMTKWRPASAFIIHIEDFSTTYIS